MSYVTHLLDQWPNYHAVAEDANLGSVHGVYKWIERQRIPGHYGARLLTAAWDRGLPIDPREMLAAMDGGPASACLIGNIQQNTHTQSEQSKNIATDCKKIAEAPL